MLERFERLYLQLILESRKDQYIEQLNNKHIDNVNDLAEYIYSFNNPKKEKVALFWLLKNSIRLPEDQDKLDKAFNLIEKQHLNYQQFNSPNDVINRSDKSTKQLNIKYGYNPDNEPMFTNGKNLGNGIVVYQVQDSKEGQQAVRKAADICWGESFDNWCLINRHVDNWDYWNRYDAYPKRIAFKNNKLLAFCANSENTIKWWDKEDNPHTNIPETNVDDDFEFIKKYCPISFAGNPNCPIEFLEKLSDDQDKDVREKVAENPNCSIDILQKLSNDKDINVRCNVAENSKCPKEILQKLSNDKNRYVRSYVAENSKCPIEILQKLSNDENEIVRGTVAKNPNCPKEILQKLSNDKNNYIRMEVVNHPNCPKEILQKLSNDQDYRVRKIIVKNPNCLIEILQKLSNDENEDIRMEVAYNPNCSIEILEKLSKDQNEHVRCSVAENPNCSIEILEKLSEDEYYFVRQYVAKNPNCSIEILQKLSENQDSWVRKTAQKRLKELQK